jgi:hypothetical protein
MKHLIERFFKMTKDEVFDCFSHLPGAQVYGKFVYIPGTKDNRILLVAHADTVFDGPPNGVTWMGNICKAGERYTLITGPAYVPPKPPEPPKVEVAPEAEVTPEVAQDAAAKNPDPTEQTIVQAATDEVEKSNGKKKGKKQKTDTEKAAGPQEQAFLWDDEAHAAFVVIGQKRIHIDEYRKMVEKEVEQPKPESKKQTYNNSNNYSGGNYNYQKWSRRGLGADDRAGVALMWLMRNSGHSILITDEEERGGHGAKAAAATIPQMLKEHLFAIQVDRMNDQEMVFYNVGTDEFKKWMVEQTAITLRNKQGFRVDIGTYTDIVDVCQAAGICGVNLAAGYWGQHTEQEHFNYDAWLRTLNVVRRLCHDPVELRRFELVRPAPKVEVPVNPPQPPVKKAQTPQISTNSTGGISDKTGGNTTPSPYKNGPRFPENSAEKTEKGIALVTTRIDPKTNEKTISRRVLTEAEDGDTAELFHEGSTPIKQALADGERLAQHAGSLDGVVGADPLHILKLQDQNAPVA